MKIKTLLLAIVIIIGLVHQPARGLLQKEDIGQTDVAINGIPTAVYLSVFGAINVKDRARYKVLNIVVNVVLHNETKDTYAYVSEFIDLNHNQWISMHEWYFRSRKFWLGQGYITATGNVTIQILDSVELQTYTAVVGVYQGVYMGCSPTP